MPPGPPRKVAPAARVTSSPPTSTILPPTSIFIENPGEWVRKCFEFNSLRIPSNAAKEDYMSSIRAKESEYDSQFHAAIPAHTQFVFTKEIIDWNSHNFTVLSRLINGS